MPTRKRQKSLSIFGVGDIVTVPTASMLQATAHATYGDDVNREDETTEALQRDMAAMTGHESGLFVLSGTMGNSLAVRSLLSRAPYAVMVDSSSNMLLWESGHVAGLTGAIVQPVEPSNGKYLVLEDVLNKVILDDDIVTSTPTQVICLENPIHGVVMPIAEVRRISQFAREHGIRLHMDGARLFDAVVASGTTLSEYASECDTVSMCFSKGLGAPVGSMLVGCSGTIRQARRLRQSIGGGIHQMGVLSAMARVGLKEVFLDVGKDGRSKMAKNHEYARQIADLWIASGGKLLKPVETCMVFLDLEEALLSRNELVTLAPEHGLRIMSERLVVHHQVTEQTIDRCRLFFHAIAGRPKTRGREEFVRGEVRIRAHGT